MKFAEGDVVTVKLSGGISVSGTIVSKKKGNQYLVKYSDGATHEINQRNIFPNPKNQLSPLGVRKARRTSPGRQTSPARQKSPSRRSPARKIKQSPSPSREKSTRKKSPSRVLKLTVEKLDVKETKTPTEVVNISFPRRRKAIEHNRQDSPSPKREEINGSDMNSIRTPIIPEYSLNSSKILHLKPDYEASVIEPEEKSLKYDARKIKTEFGGWPGALFNIFLLPVSVFALNVMCNKTSCNWHHFPKISLKLDKYFDLQASALLSLYIILITLLSVLPYVGRQNSNATVTRQGKRVYKMNGLFSLFFVGVAVAVLEFYNFPVLQTIQEKFFQLCISSLLIGIVLSFAMYVYSHYLPISEMNTHAFTGNFIYDFFMGRITNPRIFGIDLKLTTLRASLIAVVSI